MNCRKNFLVHDWECLQMKATVCHPVEVSPLFLLCLHLVFSSAVLWRWRSNGWPFQADQEASQNSLKTGVSAGLCFGFLQYSSLEKKINIYVIIRCWRKTKSASEGSAQCVWFGMVSVDRHSIKDGLASPNPGGPTVRHEIMDGLVSAQHRIDVNNHIMRRPGKISEQTMCPCVGLWLHASAWQAWDLRYAEA